MKYKMISSTEIKELDTGGHNIERYLETPEQFRVEFLDILKSSMEDVEDPDMRGKSPEGYITNLLSNRLGDFSRRVVLVNKHRNQINGVLIALPNKEFGYNIFTVGVYKSFRGQGIGSKFISKTKMILSQMGESTVTLDVHSDNSEAIKLYKKLGFEMIN